MLQELINSGKIKILNAENPTYTLTSGISFYNTEYKIMKNQTEILDCFHSKLNGNTELIYLTDNLVPLSTVLAQMNPDSFLLAATRICETIRTIDENGFLNWQFIDLNKDRIFFNMTDKTIHLVYLPITGVSMSPGLMDTEVMSFIESLIDDTRNPDAPELATLRKKTQSGNLTDLIASINGLIKKDRTANLENPVNTRLVLTNKANAHRIVINKPKFLLGKKPTAVDGVISYSRFVGRVHCQITNNGGAYYVYDFDSTNGTYVNGVQVTSAKGVRLKNGDSLKLADVTFIVEFEEA